jgi:CDP-diacylglycerol--glycerol-3-phosphate 3-phosphatidyltransferase
VHPDSLTYAAVGCGLVGAAALAFSPNLQLLLLAIPVLVAARLALNALDGMVAVRLGVARPWGKVLNEFCDRLADLAFLGPLALVPGARPLLVTLALTSMLLVSFLGVLADAAGAGRQYGGIMGKADRMAWLGLAATLSFVSQTYLPLRALPVILIGGALVTLLQRGARTHAAL